VAENIEISGTASWQNPYGYLPGRLYGFLPVRLFLSLAPALHILSLPTSQLTFSSEKRSIDECIPLCVSIVLWIDDIVLFAHLYCLAGSKCMLSQRDCYRTGNQLHPSLRLRVTINKVIISIVCEKPNRTGSQ
jgi:hypothetical protein